MKILFTGSSGPKTGATVARHLALSHELIGLDLSPAPTTTHIADIRTIHDWLPYLAGVDAVVHFAALHAPHRQSHSREEFVATNVTATARLVDAAKAAGVSRFVLASTTSVYGGTMHAATQAVWVTESLTPVSEDIYDEAKLAAEDICRAAYAPDFVTTALRFSRSFPEPLRDMALYRLYRGVDARDVAQAFQLALAVSSPQFEVFNISSATPFAESHCGQLKTDAAAVIRAVEPALAAEFAARGWVLPASIDRVYVIDKAKAVLGFAPQFGWRDALS